MRLLTGPAGSGKTASILDQLRDALRAGDRSVRLLVPTATLAQHLQNQLAREGFVFPAAIVQTLNAFIDAHADAPQASDTAFHLIVEAAARRLNRPEFARVVHMPGFSASLAKTIAEFSAAGCDSARLAAHLPEAPLAAAFLAVHREVDRELARRGFAMRAQRLQIAADRIAAAGLPGIRTVWLDGFHALPDPELRVIAALGRHTQITLTLHDSDVTDELRAHLENMGFASTRATRPRAFPALALIRAPGIEREAEEIARRILDQAAAGRPFREIGIVVRSADAYAAVLRSTLERFGIPARFYFDSKLDEHSAIRFLTGAVDAMLGRWDHAKTLAVLRLAPRFADSNTMDHFDFAVRERIPGDGLEQLKAIAGDASPLLPLIESLASLDAWRALVLTPADWVLRFQSLRNLFRPARPNQNRPQAGEADETVCPTPENTAPRSVAQAVSPASAHSFTASQGAILANHELALAYRSQSAALDAFDTGIAETAAALDPQAKLPLEEFWRSAKAAMRLTPLRLRDGRRNTVQVIGAHEARQWSLPVVFVCGMVEKQFPQLHRQNAFFPDAARHRLNAAGIRLRTSAEFEREERALFDAAITRGTLLTTLTYPEFDAGGDRNLPSIFLDDLHLPAVDAVPARPQPRWLSTPRPRVALSAPSLLDYLRTRTARLSPSGLESYLQCAFQYFGRGILKLRTAPLRPEERLSFLEQGNIVHGVLAAGYAQPETFERLFEEAFEQKRSELNIPNRYHTERLRNAMREDLLAFAADNKWPRAEFRTQTEEKFAFPLDDTVEISGRIDRIDTAADGHAYVIDYKYSATQNTKDRVKDPNLLQAPLYMMAAERAFGVKPDGVFYIGIKKSIEYAGWSRSGLLKSLPIPDDWLDIAEQRTLQAMHEIRAGRVEVAPANPAKCRFCDCRDICRVSVTAAADPAAAAEDA